MDSETFHLSNGICGVPRSRNSRRRRAHQSIAVFRLIIPASGARVSIEAATSALGNSSATLHVLK